jgi:hypothetical protein
MFFILLSPTLSAIAPALLYLLCPYSCPAGEGAKSRVASIFSLQKYFADTYAGSADAATA